jgi:hypothetical protein
MQLVNYMQKGRPLGGPSNLFAASFVQAIARAFRFLRELSRPRPPMPVAKSGSAAGSGVTTAVNTPPTWCQLNLASWSLIKINLSQFRLS